MKYIDLAEIFGYPIIESDLCSELNVSRELLEDMGFANAIFSGGASGWSWTVGGGTTATNQPATPTNNIQTLYRRSTHDENGSAKQFTPEQEQIWRDLADIATMTSLYAWKSAEEICKDATDYQKRVGRTNQYISVSVVESWLGTLVINGLVEARNG